MDDINGLRNLDIKTESISSTTIFKTTQDEDSFVDAADSRNYGQASIISNPYRCPEVKMPIDKLNTHYNMSNQIRGQTVIFVYENYAMGYPEARDCARHDADITRKAFMKLNFEVTVCWNWTTSEVIDALKGVSSHDHLNYDALVIVVMSHGGVKSGHEYFHTFDGKLNTEQLWSYFTADKCKSLAGKPKLFFIQACRGTETDKGVLLRKSGLKSEYDGVDSDRHSKGDYTLSVHSDMLFMWASYPGMYAFKSQNNGIKGSVFLHYLCQTLNEWAHQEDLFTMLLRVTREVAVQYESNVPRLEYAHLDRNKQLPYLVSTLLRKVVFVQPPLCACLNCAP